MKYTVKRDDVLQNIVLEIYKGASRSRAKQIIKFNSFVVNGIQVKNNPALELRKGDVLEIINRVTSDSMPQKPTRSKPISIYFEDDYYVIAHKPAGIITNSDSSKYNKLSFQKFLREYIQERDNRSVRLWVVHRLDREVEGLIVFAKHEEAMNRLKDMWKDVTKKYWALTERKPIKKQGIIENWLVDGHDQKVVAYDKEVPNSRYSKTEYCVLKEEGKYSLIEVTLHTGRKNQIRVHLAGIDCPIVGDRKYGADASFHRQIRLAAVYIEFHHPYTGKLIQFSYNPNNRFFKPSQNADEHYKIL